MSKRVGLWCSLILVIFFWQVSSSQAIQQITAYEAFNLLNINQGNEFIMIDVRTLEEYILVGSPALEAGGEPLAYLIPFKLFDGVDTEGKLIFKSNPDFDTLIRETFGQNLAKKFILLCQSGVRSTQAAERMVQLGFPTDHLYEIDNIKKEQNSYPGGRGGFQGFLYDNQFDGYKGYPARLPSDSGPIKVATETNNLEENDSVSWMDSGLPITHKVNHDQYPKVKTVNPPASKKTSSTSSIPSTSFYGFFPYSSFQSPFNLPQSIFNQAAGYNYQSPMMNYYSPVSSFVSSGLWSNNQWNFQPSYLSDLYQFSLPNGTDIPFSFGSSDSCHD